MMQHYNLGKLLYSKYSSMGLFNSSKLIQDQVFVESTDVQRTIQSAESQLLGLIPVDQRRGPKPLYVMTEDTCDLYPNYVLCPRLAEIRAAVVKSEKYKEFEKNVDPLKQQLLKLMSTTDFPGWTAIYDVFYCRQCHNYTLPAGWTYDLTQQIFKAAADEYNILLSNREYLVLGMGPFIQRLLSEMDQVVTEKDSTIRYVLHSGHDTTIAPLINLLGISNGLWPDYASNLIFEIYSRTEEEKENRFSVKLLYNGVDNTENICKNQLYCPWDQFVSIMKNQASSTGCFTK
jgi:hypothetical protein